ncbi:MAG TPA: hypothetical protein VHP11_12920 [Tepidisphaeraceae bacterium]|nr:hypothetical protein [Tepidisphaeraceae bacterium]
MFNAPIPGKTERLKAAYCQMFARHRFTHSLTLAWNRNVSLERARMDLRNLHRRVDEALLGRWFHRKPHRTLAVFFVEHADRNLHVHSLWKLPREHLIPFARLFPDERGGVWNDRLASGSYKLALINHMGEAVGYAMKDQHEDSDDRLTIWSDEFLPFSR